MDFVFVEVFSCVEEAELPGLNSTGTCNTGLVRGLLMADTRSYQSLEIIRSVIGTNCPIASIT